MEQESAYLAALEAAETYGFNGPTMSLLDSEGKTARHPYARAGVAD